jgi:hypothetical protein
MPSFNFTAYPNPFDSKISILAPPDYNKAVTVKIINDLGQLITDRLMNLNFLEIDLIDYSNGKYFVVITDESGEIIDTFPVVKYN